MQRYDVINHLRLSLDLMAEVIQGVFFTTPEDKLEACLFLAEAARAKAAELEAAAEAE